MIKFNTSDDRSPETSKKTNSLFFTILCFNLTPPKLNIEHHSKIYIRKTAILDNFVLKNKIPETFSVTGISLLITFERIRKFCELTNPATTQPF